VEDIISRLVVQEFDAIELTVSLDAILPILRSRSTTEGKDLCYRLTIVVRDAWGKGYFFYTAKLDVSNA